MSLVGMTNNCMNPTSQNSRFWLMRVEKWGERRVFKLLLSFTAVTFLATVQLVRIGKIKNGNVAWDDNGAVSSDQVFCMIPPLIYRAALLRAHGLPVIYHQVAAFMYRINKRCSSEFLRSSPQNPVAWLNVGIGFHTFYVRNFKSNF